MKRSVKILSIILIIQILITAAVFINEKRHTVSNKNEPLLSFKLDSINNIVIESPDKPPIELKLQNNEWILPNLYDIYVDKDKINNSLNKLFKTVKSYPVGTTTSTAKKFKLTDKGFERRISFSQDEKNLGVLYLGTSPSFRKVYARLRGEKDIYEIKFNTYDLPSDTTDWLDKKFININKFDIKKLEINGRVFSDSAGKWEIKKLLKGDSIGINDIQRVVKQLNKLQYVDVTGVKELPEYNLDNPVLSFTITTPSNNIITYKFGKFIDDYMILKASHYKWYYKIRKSSIDSLEKFYNKK